MSANNVQETSTTSGAGNLTLAGASENGRTFTSQFGLNEPFNYFIDDRAGNWETGIGHLSASTTLVRSTPLDGSAVTPVSFSGVTKQVFVAASAQFDASASAGMSAMPNNLYVKSAHWTRNSAPAVALVADRITYIPFYLDHAAVYDAISIEVTSASGTGANNIHMAVCTRASDGSPGERLISVTGLDPSTTGYKNGTFTAQSFVLGWFYFGIWSDVTPSVVGGEGGFTLDTKLGQGGSNTCLQQLFISGQSSLTELPDPATAIGSLTATYSGNSPVHYLRPIT